MQISIDNLLVALLFMFAPEQDQRVTSDPVLDSLLTTEQQRALQQAANDPSACRYFLDAEARRKCTIRTARMSRSGAAEPAGTYPETVIWMSPTEPRMPFVFAPPTPR